MASKEKCPCCSRFVDVDSDYIDYTLYAYDFNCKCGYSENYDTGSTCISFCGRWEIFLHYAYGPNNDLIKKRCKIWRKTWWLLKPIFCLANKIEFFKRKYFG